MTNTSDILTDVENIIAAALAESGDTPCAACQCQDLPQAASALAEDIADAIAYEWGGQQVYFSRTESIRTGVSSNFADEFLATLERLLSASLMSGSALPNCKDCKEKNDDWASVVSYITKSFHARALLF